MKRNDAETALQINCVLWFKMQYPKILIHHSPGGGERKRFINRKGEVYCPEGAKFKQMGCVAGFPDLFIACPKISKCFDTQDLHGLFIEFKTETGKLSPAQKDIAIRLSGAGYQVSVCRSLDEFIKTVNEYMK